MDREVGAFGEVLAQEAISILVGAALPVAVGVAQVSVEIGGQRLRLLSAIGRFIPKPEGADTCQSVNTVWRTLLLATHVEASPAFQYVSRRIPIARRRWRLLQRLTSVSYRPRRRVVCHGDANSPELP